MYGANVAICEDHVWIYASGFDKLSSKTTVFLVFFCRLCPCRLNCLQSIFATICQFLGSDGQSLRIISGIARKQSLFAFAIDQILLLSYSILHAFMHTVIWQDFFTNLWGQSRVPIISSYDFLLMLNLGQQLYLLCSLSLWSKIIIIFSEP